MAVGFALALLAADRMGLGLGVFILGWLVSWVALEFFYARHAPTERKDFLALGIGVGTGFVTPWGGFLLAALANLARG